VVKLLFVTAMSRTVYLYTVAIAIAEYTLLQGEY
jgi:hypothetical protein